MIESFQAPRATLCALALGFAVLTGGTPVTLGQTAEDADGDGLLNVE